MRENLKEEVSKKFSKKNKPVENFYISQTLSGRAIVRMTIDLKNQVKPVESFIVASYCPWCGKDYGA